ncbi:MAG: PD-(D/E)XK nuclease family protein [Anaerolineaceae bacterium]
MEINNQFTFSAYKLQDYLDCERRFELKYLLKQQWPAIQSEPIHELEQQMQFGQQFHLFAQQFFSNIPTEEIQKQVDNETLNSWWGNFVPFAKSLLTKEYFAERKIGIKLSNTRFIAILDLLVIDKKNTYTIIDWKTNKKKPSSQQIKNSIQSRLYPLVLFLSENERISPNKISPDQIEMIYWFANFPDKMETFKYSNYQFEEDLSFFQEIIQKISLKKTGEFLKTTRTQLCKYCQYRSLCERGTTPGSLDNPEDEIWNEEILDIDFSQIGEVEF